MSKVSITGNASGSATFTIAAPATNTDRTLTLPDNSGTVQTQLDQGFSFRNRLINPGMVIDQRNAGASVTPASSAFTYTLDRWNFYVSQASKLTTQRNAGSVTPPAGFSNYLGVTSSSAYSITSSDLFSVQQTIEGFNVADLGWGTANAQAVTLSFWVRSSLTGAFGGAVQNTNSGANRSYPFTYSISAANTWEYKTVTIPGDTTGTWGTTNGEGLTLKFGLGVGSTFSGTAGVWAGSNFWSSTGAVSVVGTSGATFYITGVQLEAGSVATTFERRPYGTELMLCQRYFQFWKSGWGGVSGGSGYQYSDGVNFSVPTRATPTLALTSWSTGARFPQASWFTTNVGVEGFLSIATANAAGGNDNWLATGTASAEL